MGRGDGRVTGLSNVLAFLAGRHKTECYKTAVGWEHCTSVHACSAIFLSALKCCKKAHLPLTSHGKYAKACIAAFITICNHLNFVQK